MQQGLWMRTLRVVTVLWLGLLGVGSAQAAGAGDANMPNCPQGTAESAGFRAYLPDCRAYELVSPPYTGGFEVIGGLSASSNYAARISASGGSAEGVSLGTVAGGQYSWSGGGILGSPYRFVRGPAGWTTEASIPAYSQLPSPINIDASADLDRGLWTSGADGRFDPERAGPDRLFFRELNGTFMSIGPMEPLNEKNAIYAGGSANLGRIAFALKGQSTDATPFWPGDQTLSAPTGQEYKSLYEYSGAGQSEPSLVGVRNLETIKAAAQKEGKTHINEAAQQITQCGTSVGFQGVGGETLGDVYNAVSPSGYGIFFTASPEGCIDEAGEIGTGPAVAELYLRVEGEGTVNLSNPVYPPGVECTGTCASAEQKQGEFAGASEDGHTVFFMTEQPLVNGDNDSTKDLYMEEIAGAGAGAHVQRIVQVSHDPTAGQAAEVEGVVRVSADGNRVYFVAKGLLTADSNGNGEVAELERPNLYVYDHQSGSIAFVTKLTESDEALWATANWREAQTSRSDGRYFVFVSEAQPINTGDTSSAGQLFRYDAATKSLVRVSIGAQGLYPCSITGEVEEGYNCNGNITSAARAPGIRLQEYRIVDLADAPYMEVNVTPEGAVFFESRLALTPEVQNGYPNTQPGYKNVYEYQNGAVYLISDGVEPPIGFNAAGAGITKTAFVSATAGGGALLLTSESLVPQDTGSQVSLYDARIDGGFPGPSAVETCTGAACRSAGTAPGVEPQATTSVPQSVGNVRQHAKKKHAKKKHAKKKHAKKKHAKKKHAKKKKRGGSGKGAGPSIDRDITGVAR